MEWPLAFLLIMGGLIVFMVTGMPVAFSFMLINLIGVLLFWGGGVGIEQLILSLRDSVTSFTLLPLPLFVLMGEIIFHSGVAPRIMDAVDKWIGRLPGRLGLLAVGGGVVFSTFTGASMASTAMLGSLLVPEMEKRGYKKTMSLGPILGSGGLAMMIPPSGLAVLLGALAQISIGRILIGIIMPGVLMAILYAGYIIIRCKLQPSIAPPYKVSPSPLSEKLAASARYILPLTFIIFLVIGVIILGIATPSEAAAMGALGCFILAACYRRLNWEAVKNSFTGTLRTSAMILIIIVGAKAFSQILNFSGASRGLIELALGFPVHPILIIIAMQVVLLMMGMFMGATAMMMITLPIYVPVINNLGFDPVWFAVIYLLNLEMAQTTPPFGNSLFVIKAVAPPDTKMGDIYRAGLPFIYIDLLTMALIITFPAIAIWLPGIMR